MQWWQCEEWLWRWDWRCVTTGTWPEDLALPLSMTLEAHTGGKGQKPFFFPFIQRKIKGEHARTAIKGERGHEKTTARFVCRRREGNLLCLVIFWYVVWKRLSGLYCEPVWTCRYAHCPSSNRKIYGTDDSIYQIEIMPRNFAEKDKIIGILDAWNKDHDILVILKTY